MKDLAQRDLFWAVVLVGGHDVFHERPPIPTSLRVRDRGPLGFVFDFRIREKLVGLGVQEYGVVVHAVVFQHGFEIGPKGSVASLIFLVVHGVHFHDECFTDHKGY